MTMEVYAYVLPDIGSMMTAWKRRSRQHNNPGSGTCVECYFIGVFRRILTAFGLLLVVTTVCNAHFFTQPGGFPYAQYKLNHKVIVTTADGKMAVVLKNDEYPNSHRALITTFDPTPASFLITRAWDLDRSESNWQKRKTESVSSFSPAKVDREGSIYSVLIPPAT